MRKIYFYTHTHWDREWHQPFESFRAQLIPVVSNILGGLETGALPKFYLDGQAVIFEDILEIDSSLEPRLKACMSAGNLTAGPWYVLADQMLVSGESLIRNLKYGLALTQSFGEPARIGYCPDTFGHSQDLPRILSGFGIKNAVVWRGVPLLETGPAFWWASPDGSQVLAYHLTRGYYQTGFHEADVRDYGVIDSGTARAGAAQLAQSLMSWVDLAPWQNGGACPYYKAIDGALLPIGADHVGPPPHLNDMVNAVNECFDRSGAKLKLVSTTLADFLGKAAVQVKKSKNVVPVIAGELRSNSAAAHYERSYLLYGVLSTRLYLKRANRLSEYKLSRLCEPLFSIIAAMNLTKYPSGQFDYAWKLLMKNHAHDSICGCSVDEVHREMMTRSARLDDIFSCLLGEAANAVAGRQENSAIASADPAFVCNSLSVFNVGAGTASGPVALKWFMDLDDKRIWRGNNIQIDSQRKVDQLFSGWGAVPYYKEVQMVEGWVWAQDVPGIGVKSFEWPCSDAAGAKNTVQVGGNKLSNGQLSVKVQQNGNLTIAYGAPDGTSKVFELGHRIRDIGDGGDSYNFDPIPGDKPLQARLISVSAGKKGPLVGSLLLTYEISVPEKAVDDSALFKIKDPNAINIKLLKRSQKHIKHKIITELSLKRDTAVLFFETAWQNFSADHRLEVVFDTEHRVETTYSENHFGCVERSHVSPPKHESLPVQMAHESPPDRYPCQRFFIANGQLFLNTGLPEYGVNGKEVSITLLRAISWLSKGRLWTRGGGAGPSLPVPEANSHSYNVCSYGWAPLPVPTYKIEHKHKIERTSLTADVAAAAYSLAEQYEGVLWATTAKAEHLTSNSLVSIDNNVIKVVAFYFDADQGKFFLRLLNVSMDPQRAKLIIDQDLFCAATIVALDGSEQDTLDLAESDGCFLEFRQNELKTVALLKR